MLFKRQRLFLGQSYPKHLHSCLLNIPILTDFFVFRAFYQSLKKLALFALHDEAQVMNRKFILNVCAVQI